MAPTSVNGRPKTLMTDGSPRWRSLQIHVVSGADLMMGIGAWSHSSASRPSQQIAECLDVDHFAESDNSRDAGSTRPAHAGMNPPNRCPGHRVCRVPPRAR